MKHGQRFAVGFLLLLSSCGDQETDRTSKARAEKLKEDRLASINPAYVAYVEEMNLKQYEYYGKVTNGMALRDVEKILGLPRVVYGNERWYLMTYPYPGFAPEIGAILVVYSNEVAAGKGWYGIYEIEEVRAREQLKKTAR